MGKKEKQRNCDVLISGGGVPGLVLRALLGGLGLSVIVIDPHPPIEPQKPSGRTAALMAGSVNILKAAGVWNLCADQGAPLEVLRIIEGKAARADFRASEIDLPYFGINMPNAALRGVMAGEIEQDEITALAPDSFGITATLKSGREIRARLLVGADGRGSATRALCNIGTWIHDYGQRAITCLIDHSKPHDFISTEFHRPGGPFTIVPLPGKRSSIVWVEYAADAEKFMRMRRDEFVRALQDRTQGLVGEVDLACAPAAWPLMALRAKALVAPRVALVAEAAHVLHPLGAQGLNLSLRDVAALAEEIADAARTGLDIGGGSVLARYAFRRRADILTRAMGTDGLNRAVSNESGLLKSLRSAGLKMVDGFTPLRRFAMQEGVLPGYDDSRLARGETL